MNLEQFKKDKVTAMKEHNKDDVAALNSIISKLMLITIDKRSVGQEITDADVVTVLKKTESEIIEERDAFIKAGREETVASLNNQVALVQKYLPKFLSKEEIKQIINTLDDKSIPAVMKHFKNNYAGKVDMKLVNETLKSL